MNSSKIKPYSIRCLEAIIALFGSKKEFANELGIDLQTVYRWIRNGKIGEKYVLSVQLLSEGKFSAEDLMGKFDNVDKDK